VCIKHYKFIFSRYARITLGQDWDTKLLKSIFSGLTNTYLSASSCAWIPSKVSTSHSKTKSKGK
jgi:hypothetical protein